MQSQCSARHMAVPGSDESAEPVDMNAEGACHNAPGSRIDMSAGKTHVNNLALFRAAKIGKTGDTTKSCAGFFMA